VRRERAGDSAGEIRLFWVVLWAVSVAFALGVYRPGWEALERRRGRKRDLMAQIEHRTEENARWRAGIAMLEAGDRRTWETVIRRRYGYSLPGEVPSGRTELPVGGPER